ncbi:hypothetical protein WJ25_11695 [Burkholderia thailandensis]|nr:hypothetical protein WJ25_11695 [Burkholderia thailandensis]
MGIPPDFKETDKATLKLSVSTEIAVQGLQPIEFLKFPDRSFYLGVRDNAMNTDVANQRSILIDIAKLHDVGHFHSFRKLMISWREKQLPEGSI